MIANWWCGRCKKHYSKKFNLQQVQTGFVIKVIQVECPRGHSNTVRFI